MDQITVSVVGKMECDVLVVGGGVAGISAAICAARVGGRVALAEKGSALGGTATAGMISTFMTSLNCKGDKQIIKGFYSEFTDRLAREQAATRYTECLESNSVSGYRLKGHLGCVAYAPDAVKTLAESMCAESGVELYYGMLLLGCQVQNGSIKAAYFASPEGVYEIRAKQFIDTTGDAHLAHFAGAETAYGDADGTTQTASLFFSIRGVDKELLDRHMREHTDMESRFYMAEIRQARQEGRFPCGTPKLRIYEGIDGVWSVNMAQVDEQLDALNSKAITDATVAQRRQIEQIFLFLKETIPALKNIEMVRTAEALGIREGRRLVGEYVLTAEDMQSSRHFDDAVVYCANSIDIHFDSRVCYIPYESDENYTIPLRSLMAKELDNLMVAGRCLSATHEALAAVRVMPPCFAMGQAAGVAAATAVAQDRPLKQVPFLDIRARLEKDGCYFE